MSRSCQYQMQTTNDLTHLMLPRYGLLKDYPKLEIGLMILNRNPDNYSAEVKQGGDLYRIMGEAEKAKLMITLRAVFPEPARKRLV